MCTKEMLLGDTAKKTCFSSAVRKREKCFYRGKYFRHGSCARNFQSSLSECSRKEKKSLLNSKRWLPPSATSFRVRISTCSYARRVALRRFGSSKRSSAAVEP